MIVSQGYKKELLFLTLCKGLIVTYKDVESGVVPTDDYTIKLNCNSNLKRRITQRSNTIVKKIDDYLTNVAPYEALQYSKTHSKKFYFKVIDLVEKKANNKMQLNLLALWVLYFRFSPNERCVPLHEDFNFINKLDIDTLLNLIDDTDANKASDVMVDLALEISLCI